MMLSNSSAIAKRRQMHRRQNSTPAVFEAAQIRAPPALMQRHGGHRRGMSYDHNARTPGHISPGNISVSIPELTEQHLQHHMQEAQQQSNYQPGIPFPQTPLTPQFQQQQPTPSQTPQNPYRPSAQEIRDLEDHIKRVYGVHGSVYVSILPTPVSTPEKPSHLPVPEDLDIAPMPTSLGQMADLSLEPPPGDIFDAKPLDICDSDGYESSYYSSDALSPGRSPSCSPQQKSIATYLDQVRHPAHLSFPVHNAASFPPTQQAVSEMNPFYGLPDSPGSPRSKALCELNIPGSVLDTGFSEGDIGQFMSEQDPQNGKWTCMFDGCGKNFGRKENIRSHIQTHLGDRQFKCNYCDKCFVRSHDLKRHVLIHSDEKPYGCQCGSRFARQDALTRHKQRGMCEGGIHNPARGSARRGRPRKDRPDMQKRVDKANKTRKAVAAARSPTPETSFFSSDPPEAAHSSPQSWVNIHTTAEPFCDNSIATQQVAAAPICEDPIVNNIYQLTSEFVSHTPPMSATDSPSPLSMSSPEFSSEPDADFSKSFFDPVAAKLDDIFTGFDGKEADWVEEMMNGGSDPVF